MIRQSLTKILMAIALPLAFSMAVSACGTDDDPTPVETPTPTPGGEETPDDPEAPDEPENPDTPEPPVAPVVPEAPAQCSNKIVAHRGGAMELGESVPDNSIAALEYAEELGCYASECDIYVTKDNRVVVAHVDGDGKINGYYPFEATLDQLRAAGTLANGEQLPTLEDYLDNAMTEGSCTRLWLDIKNVTQPDTYPGYSIAACRLACRIVTEKKAEKWVEFICTGNSDVMVECEPEARKIGVPIGWMANRSVAEYRQRGYEWANIKTTYMTDATHTGPRTIGEFASQGIAISVYNVDKAKNIKFYLERADQLKAICTNYPALLLEEMEKMK